MLNYLISDGWNRILSKFKPQIGTQLCLKNKDKSYDLLKWRFYCYMNPQVKLIVVDKLKKKDEKNCLFKFTKKKLDCWEYALICQKNIDRNKVIVFILYLY